MISKREEIPIGGTRILTGVIMGAKIESLKLLESLGLPVPQHVFVFNEDELDGKFRDFANAQNASDRFGIRTDTENKSLSLPRKFAATREEILELARKWLKEGYQVIIQENIEPEIEEKSGNVYINNDKIVIEVANEKHHVMVNQQKVDVYMETRRFGPFGVEKLVHYNNVHSLSNNEFMRLVRLARKIPFDEALLEFSFTKDGRLFFWEIKKF